MFGSYPLRTKTEFIESLNDNRTVYFKGKQIEDITTHEFFAPVIRHLALEYEIAEDPRYRDLVTYELADKTRSSRYFKIPEDSDDLLKRNEMIDLGTRLAGTVVLLIKEIGTDCLFALNMLSKRIDARLHTNYFSRVSKFHEY